VAMKISIFFPSSLALALMLSVAAAQVPQSGASSALEAVPPQFARGIVRLSADNGRPNPARWYVLARNSRDVLVHSIVIVRGQAASVRPSLDARQILNRRNFINRSRVRVDSNKAFEIARTSLGGVGQRMRSASYQLTQSGPGVDPLWEVWAYGKRDRYLGVVQLSARTGSVFSVKRGILSGLP
jgi:hypothetical protein